MSYGVFAAHYDALTANVNYAGYARRVKAILNRFLPDCRSIVELACGTASLGFELEKQGFSVTGTDISKEMLAIAERKAVCRHSKITFSRQDMRMLSLEHPADAVVCSLDALNHLDGLSDITMTFHSVRNCLKRGGLFIFDMNTPYKHREILGDNTFVYDLPQVYTVWSNSYRETDCSVGITLDFFVHNENNEYQRYTEEFREKAYKTEMILNALRSCGLEIAAVFDELKNSAPVPRTERILYVARRT